MLLLDSFNPHFEICNHKRLFGLVYDDSILLWCLEQGKVKIQFCKPLCFRKKTTTVALQNFLQLFARTKVPEALSNLPYPRSTTDSLKLHNPCYFSNGRTFREHRVRENSVQDQSKLIKQIQAEVCRRVYYALGFLIQTSSWSANLCLFALCTRSGSKFVMDLNLGVCTSIYALPSLLTITQACSKSTLLELFTLCSCS